MKTTSVNASVLLCIQYHTRQLTVTERSSTYKNKITILQLWNGANFAHIYIFVDKTTVEDFAMWNFDCAKCGKSQRNRLWKWKSCSVLPNRDALIRAKVLVNEVSYRMVRKGKSLQITAVNINRFVHFIQLRFIRLCYNDINLHCISSFFSLHKNSFSVKSVFQCKSAVVQLIQINCGCSRNKCIYRKLRLWLSAGSKQKRSEAWKLNSYLLTQGFRWKIASKSNVEEMFPCNRSKIWQQFWRPRSNPTTFVSRAKLIPQERNEQNQLRLCNWNVENQNRYSSWAMSVQSPQTDMKVYGRLETNSCNGMKQNDLVSQFWKKILNPMTRLITNFHDEIITYHVRIIYTSEVSNICGIFGLLEMIKTIRTATKNCSSLQNAITVGVNWSSDSSWNFRCWTRKLLAQNPKLQFKTFLVPSSFFLGYLATMRDQGTFSTFVCEYQSTRLTETQNTSPCFGSFEKNKYA